MRSDAHTVTEYIARLPEERRAAIREVRGTILANLSEGYEEAMEWGMITYQGKSCVRFTKLENLPLDLIGKVIRAYPVDDYIGIYEAGRG
jgi:hypothetical protein